MESEERSGKQSGRPKKEVLRDKFTGTWFTVEEYETVKQKAVQAGLTISHFLRQAALKASVVGKLTPEQNDYLNQLAGMGRNLNQIAHRGHIEGYLSAITEFNFYREKLSELISKLSR